MRLHSKTLCFFGGDTQIQRNIAISSCHCRVEFRIQPVFDPDNCYILVPTNGSKTSSNFRDRIENDAVSAKIQKLGYILLTSLPQLAAKLVRARLNEFEPVHKSVSLFQLLVWQT